MYMYETVNGCFNTSIYLNGPYSVQVFHVDVTRGSVPVEFCHVWVSVTFCCQEQVEGVVVPLQGFSIFLILQAKLIYIYTVVPLF